ncbi:hypothetical protein Glove_54g112 [Diversispora epigaea]|uniref:Uncharacterized protein n=1 Tax=Diversispora epigaea TaxID=1348612 RepID=A0A397JG49_9GLOM|nr:hypothetical protein Glove_54g112 [Diversispora epigaea]
MLNSGIDKKQELDNEIRKFHYDRIISIYMKSRQKSWRRFHNLTLEKGSTSLRENLKSIYRTTKNRTTKYKLFYLLYGRASILPIELDIITWPVEEIDEKQFKKMIYKRTGEASKNIKDAQKRQKITHDRKIKMIIYKTRDMVLEYRSDLQNVHGDKFCDKWTGSFFIYRVLGNGFYILRINSREVLNNQPIYGNQIKFYKQRDELLRIVTDMHGTNDQRLNAYKKLGDYLQDAQLGNWIYKLPKIEFERFLQLCKTMGTQLMKNLLEIDAELQKLSFKRGNVCGKVNW